MRLRALGAPTTGARIRLTSEFLLGRAEAEFSDAIDWLFPALGHQPSAACCAAALAPRRAATPGRSRGFMAPIQNQGTVDTLEQAQAELLAAWRRWQDWAEVRDK